MYTRVLQFLNKHSILYEYRFGFRQNHSTTLALVVLIDRITHAIENGEYVLGFFLDFSKAFDTVDHNILMHKIKFIGIR